MSDLGELYQALILDHNKSPKNFGDLDDATHHADGFNPLCGDRFSVDLRVGDDGRIEDVKFTGKGCAISKASASLMTTQVKGKTTAEAEALFDKFHHLVTEEAGAVHADSLGKLGVFAGVREFPMRVKCATLAWHTVHAALHNQETASTE